MCVCYTSLFISHIVSNNQVKTHAKRWVPELYWLHLWKIINQCLYDICCSTHAQMYVCLGVRICFQDCMSPGSIFTFTLVYNMLTLINVECTLFCCCIVVNEMYQKSNKIGLGERC